MRPGVHVLDDLQERPLPTQALRFPCMVRNALAGRATVDPLTSGRSVLETFHTVFVLHQLYFYLISSDVPILILDNIVWCVAIPNGTRRKADYSVGAFRYVEFVRTILFLRIYLSTQALLLAAVRSSSLLHCCDLTVS